MSTEIPTRIGIMGGTFDPIHNGHLFIAEEARELLGLTRVLFMVNRTPPLDKGRAPTSPEHRLAMVEIATAPNPAFEVSRLEIDRPGPSYTIDTVRAVKAGSAEGTEIVWITGADVVAELPRWHDYRNLLRECRFVTVMRPVCDLDEQIRGAEIAIRENVQILQTPFLEISSTDIRERLVDGRTVRYLLPDAVIDYIDANGLYTVNNRVS